MDNIPDCPDTNINRDSTYSIGTKPGVAPKPRVRNKASRSFFGFENPTKGIKHSTKALEQEIKDFRAPGVPTSPESATSVLKTSADCRRTCTMRQSGWARLLNASFLPCSPHNVWNWGSSLFYVAPIARVNQSLESFAANSCAAKLQAG
jgi:hypothetical protein